MRMLRLNKLSTPICIAVALLAASAMPSSASKISRTQFLPKTVNVSVSFNTQTPIADTDKQTIAALQHASRSMFYRMTLKECAALKEIIADTCKLRSLNVSSRLNRQQNGSTSLYINGSAQFSITLKKLVPQ